MQIKLRNRDFTEMPGQPMLTWSFDRLSWSDRGGPKSAQLTAYGDARDLGLLAGMLRCPVDIYDDSGVWIWGGMLKAVEVTSQGVTVGYDLDTMANKIYTAYSFVSPNSNMVGERKTTAAASDANSIAVYGTKEILDSAPGLSDASAIARRDGKLARLKYPQGVVSSGFGDDHAVITCIGWWDTLSWRLASWASVAAISYQVTAGSADQALGAAAANTKLMQQITVTGASINVLDIQIYGRKVAAPADNLVVEIYAQDGSGNPSGVALASVSIAGGGLTTVNGWITGTFASSVNLAVGSYCIQLSRSGANDGVNYYMWVVNAALGYTGGAFKLWGGAAWAARGTDADGLFIIDVDNAVDSVAQARELIATYGQFISSNTLWPATLSGQRLPSYRDGDTDTLSEVTRLMDLGGTNSRRLIARIDENRLAIISEEPADTSTTYQIGPKMAILDNSGSPLEVEWRWRAIGSWAQLSNVMAQSADVSHLLDVSQQYISGGTLQGGVFTPEFRGTTMPGDMWSF
jgi:hypothetical protein